MKMTLEQIRELRAAIVHHFREDIARQVAAEIVKGNIPDGMGDVYIQTVMTSTPVQASIDAFVARHQGALH